MRREAHFLRGLYQETGESGGTSTFTRFWRTNTAASSHIACQQGLTAPGRRRPSDQSRVWRRGVVMDELAIRLVVEGRVQGVGYRWWAQGHAQRLGLRGWVRNRRDGSSANCFAIGGAEAVEQFVADCWRGTCGRPSEVRHAPRGGGRRRGRVRGTVDGLGLEPTAWSANGLTGIARRR